MDPKALVAALIERGLSQTEIAARCSCSQASISAIHSGDTKKPNWEIVEALRRLHRGSRSRVSGKPIRGRAPEEKAEV